MQILLFISWDWWHQFWPHVVGVGSVLAFAADVIASGHVVLHKRDTRSAIGWVGIIWLVPVVGVLLYLWLGINRISRKARILRGDDEPVERAMPECICAPEMLGRFLPPEAAHLHTLARCIGAVTEQPLLHGNRVTPLRNGEQAYPAMLQAIDEAQRSVALGTYIFDNDAVGSQFVDALARAVARGVEVRVLVDDIGARYHFPPVTRALKQHQVRAARFLPTIVPGYFAYSNLRCHRKILVTDGRVGFTGGMNIRGHKIRDLHFRITGPVVAQLQHVFADDWKFSTGEELAGEVWFPPLAADGDVLARGISDGPDEDFEKLRLSLLGALACAESSVTVMTPYFLPDSSLIVSLGVAAMRGVQVDIILPEQNNLLLVQWASMGLLWQVLEKGCRVWLAPPPFDHTKLMIVDRAWTLLGSGNWDARSLRLNFEFNVECYDPALAHQLHEMAGETARAGKPVTLADVDGRSLPIKLRDGVARLLSPYL